MSIDLDKSYCMSGLVDLYCVNLKLAPVYLAHFLIIYLRSYSSDRLFIISFLAKYMYSELHALTKKTEIESYDKNVINQFLANLILLKFCYNAN